MRLFTISVVSLLMFFVSACENNKSGHLSDQYSDVEKAITEELNSGTVVDTIFLGYRFGMTKKEVTTYTRKLIRNKKLKSDEDGYYYEFVLKQNILKGYLLFKYHENKIVKLYITIGDEYLTNTMTKLLLESKYFQKYVAEKEYEDKAKFYTTNRETLDLAQHYYVKGNLEIEIYNKINYGTVIEYTDTKIARDIAQLNDQKENLQVDDL